MNAEAIAPGLQVKWFARSKPSGWHYGEVVRLVTRGKNKGLAEIAGADGRHYIAPAALNPHLSGQSHA